MELEWDSKSILGPIATLIWSYNCLVFCEDINVMSSLCLVVINVVFLVSSSHKWCVFLVSRTLLVTIFCVLKQIYYVKFLGLENVEALNVILSWRAVPRATKGVSCHFCGQIVIVILKGELRVFFFMFSLFCSIETIFELIRILHRFCGVLHQIGFRRSRIFRVRFHSKLGVRLSWVLIR